MPTLWLWRISQIQERQRYIWRSYLVWLSACAMTEVISERCMPAPHIRTLGYYSHFGCDQVTANASGKVTKDRPKAGSLHPHGRPGRFPGSWFSLTQSWLLLSLEIWTGDGRSLHLALPLPFKFMFNILFRSSQIYLSSKRANELFPDYIRISQTVFKLSLDLWLTFDMYCKNKLVKAEMLQGFYWNDVAGFPNFLCRTLALGVRCLHRGCPVRTAVGRRAARGSQGRGREKRGLPPYRPSMDSGQSTPWAICMWALRERDADRVVLYALTHSPKDCNGWATYRRWFYLIWC